MAAVKAFDSCVIQGFEPDIVVVVPFFVVALVRARRSISAQLRISITMPDLRGFAGPWAGRTRTRSPENILQMIFS